MMDEQTEWGIGGGGRFIFKQSNSPVSSVGSSANLNNEYLFKQTGRVIRIPVSCDLD